MRWEGYSCGMSLGVPELLIILVILLLVFGPKRLPGLGKQLGDGLRDFRRSLAAKDADEDGVVGATADDEADKPAQLPAGPPSA